MSRESFERFSQSFSSQLSMYLDHSINRVIFACLGEFTQNSTLICEIMWQACKFELNKFLHSNLWGLFGKHHVWLNKILTLKISLKFVGLCGKHASLVKPYIDTQYPLTQTWIFPLRELSLF